jgi:hypothetical protein
LLAIPEAQGMADDDVKRTFELRSKTNALMNPTVEAAVSGQRIDRDGDPRHKPQSSPLESIAPRPRLAAELRRVAESAQRFVNELTANTNLEVNPRFPKQKLIDVAGTLIDLSAGSEDGALPALEYAETALNDMRFSFVEIAEGDRLPDIPRGGRVDQSLVTLISDIGTAKRFYSQSKLDAAAKTETPDHAVAEIGADRSKIAEGARAISRTGFKIAGDLDKSTAELVELRDRVATENLSRKSRDVANLARQEGIEIGGRTPRISWLEKLGNGLEIALRGVELSA